MNDSALERLMDQLKRLDPSADSYATQVLDHLMDVAVQLTASDIHLEKNQFGLMIRMRIAGRLIDLGQVPDGRTTQVLARVKAVARLVSYRSDIPQEGRLQLNLPTRTQEARVGTLPLVDGERAVIRLSADQAVPWLPRDLGLPAAVLEQLLATLQQSSGVILVTGPAGSGKTTTVYAALRHLVSQSSVTRSLVSLEDPVEAILPGVSQSQISQSSGYDWHEGLKAILRQDPEVLLIGEIRDDATARLVFQSAMSGQLVLSTMHARSASDSLRRLLDMNVPVHHLLSCLDFLVCQRLGLPKPESATVNTEGMTLALRQLTCELLPPMEAELAQSLLGAAGSREIEIAARGLGMKTFVEQCQHQH